MEDNNYKHDLKNAMESFDIPMIPVEDAYAKFLNEKKKRRGFFWWWFGGLAVVLLGFGLGYYYNKKAENGVTKKSELIIGKTETVVKSDSEAALNLAKNEILNNQFKQKEKKEINSDQNIVSSNNTISGEGNLLSGGVVSTNTSNKTEIGTRATAVKLGTNDTLNVTKILPTKLAQVLPEKPLETATSVTSILGNRESVSPDNFNLLPTYFNYFLKPFNYKYTYKKFGLEPYNPIFKVKNMSIIKPTTFGHKYFVLLAVNDPLNVFPGAIYRKMNVNVGLEKQLGKKTYFYAKGGLNAFNLRRQYLNNYDTINGDIYHDSIRFNTLRQLGVGMGFVGNISKRSRLGFGFTYAWNINIKGTNYQTIQKSSGNSETINKPYTLNRAYFKNLNFNTKGLNLNVFFITEINRRFDFTIESNLGFTTINNNLLYNGVDKSSLVSTPRALFFGLKYNFY